MPSEIFAYKRAGLVDDDRIAERLREHMRASLLYYKELAESSATGMPHQVPLSQALFVTSSIAPSSLDTDEDAQRITCLVSMWPMAANKLGPMRERWRQCMWPATTNCGRN